MIEFSDKIAFENISDFKIKEIFENIHPEQNLIEPILSDMVKLISGFKTKQSLYSKEIDSILEKIKKTKKAKKNFDVEEFKKSFIELVLMIKYLILKFKRN